MSKFLKTFPVLNLSESQDLRNKIFIRGIAVVSSDALIAGSSGGTAWASAEDKEYFFKVLQEPALLVMGRKTFELSASKNLSRKRLIFSRTQSPADHHNSFINFPENDSEDEKLKLLKKLSELSSEFEGKILILGGSEIYSLILKTLGYNAFDLTIEDQITLNSGRPLFSGINFSLEASLISGKKPVCSSLSTKTRLLLYR